MTRRSIARKARAAAHTTVQHYRAKSPDPVNCRTCAGRRAVARADTWIAAAEAKLARGTDQPSA